MTIRALQDVGLILLLLLILCCTVFADEYCSGIQPGDIMTTGFNMDNPDEVLLVVLQPIEEGGTFYMTDRPWDGAEFLDSDNDGTLKVLFGRFEPHRSTLFELTPSSSSFSRYVVLE